MDWNSNKNSSPDSDLETETEQNGSTSSKDEELKLFSFFCSTKKIVIVMRCFALMIMRKQKHRKRSWQKGYKRVIIDQKRIKDSYFKKSWHYINSSL